MKQIELSKGKLLDDDGNLTESGFAYDLVKEYDRSKIKVNAFRIKEWDYYYIGNDHYGIALTIADNSYMGLFSVTFLHFDWLFEKTKTIMTAFPFGKTHFHQLQNLEMLNFQIKI